MVGCVRSSFATISLSLISPACKSERMRWRVSSAIAFTKSLKSQHVTRFTTFLQYLSNSTPVGGTKEWLCKSDQIGQPREESFIHLRCRCLQAFSQQGGNELFSHAPCSSLPNRRRFDDDLLQCSQSFGVLRLGQRRTVGQFLLRNSQL